MNYNLKARKELVDFIEYVNGRMTLRAPDDIKNISTRALALFNEYTKSPEQSSLARLEYFNVFLRPLREYRTLIINEKSWWEQLIGFFGFLPPEEKDAEAVMKRIEHAYSEASTKYDTIHYPNFIFTTLRFFGVNLIKKMIGHEEYDEYDPKEKLAYLSHHLMGNINLNRHEVLNGKTRSDAYRHFQNDLQAFINVEGARLDRQTQILLNTLQNQVHQSSEFANELDFTALIRKLSDSKDNMEEFVLDIAYQVQKAILELTPGQSLIIPGGYRSTDGGHATVIECTRANEQEVFFKIINTGAGEMSTESYKTLFTSLINGKNIRPIKVTSNLKIEDIISDGFIEKLLTPVIIPSKQASEDMTQVFRELYNANKLHDDKQQLTLQTNGTCGHSSLLAWFKTQVPESIFLLFNFVTTKKALHRLEEFTKSYKHSDFPKDISEPLSELYAAGQQTVQEAQKQLESAKRTLETENGTLKKELDKLLAKKGKSSSGITDFTAYYEKKCRGPKLSSNEQEQIMQTNPMDSPNSKGIFGSLFNKNTSTDRAQKAVIAKKIAGHNGFAEAVEPLIVSNTPVNLML